MQLNFLEGLFPTELEQIASIDQAESVNAPSAFSIPSDMIDLVLRMGNEEERTRQQVMMAFMQDKSMDEIADLLKELYGGGNGFEMNGQRVCAWYADDGIHLTQGMSAQYDTMAQVLTWRDAAERIGQMIAEGRYGTMLDQAAAPARARQELAQQMWHLYHDLSSEARKQGTLSLIGVQCFEGFPEDTERLAQVLGDPDYLTAVTMQYESFLADHAQNRSLLNFHYHDLERILARIRDLALPVHELPQQLEPLPEARAFLTDDDINAGLVRGNLGESRKERIYRFFQTPHTRKEQIDFLKHECGIGGFYRPRTQGQIDGITYNSKGITIEKEGCEDVHLTWSQVAKRIESLIQQDRYLTPDEHAHWVESRETSKEADVESVDAPELDIGMDNQAADSDGQEASQEEQPVALSDEVNEVNVPTAVPTPDDSANRAQSKVMTYLELANQTAHNIVQNEQSWTDYLTTAARLYKYDFTDQLMIHAQRPDATACASYDLWNNTMRRYVRRGAKGIALLDDSGSNLRLRYVFDVSDTGTRQNSREVRQWQLDAENEKIVSDMLTRVYECPSEIPLAMQLRSAALELVERYWDDHFPEITDFVDAELIGQHTAPAFHEAFTRAVTTSVAFILQSRCGLQPENQLDPGAFQWVSKWNNHHAIHALGNAVSQVSGEVLRQIERTITAFERDREQDVERVPGIQVASMAQVESAETPSAFSVPTETITQEEIDAVLCYGSVSDGNKGRIYGTFLIDYPLDQLADYLKEEYTEAGLLSGFAWNMPEGAAFDSTGVTISKPMCEDVHLTWEQMAARISELVMQDRYLTQEEAIAWAESVGIPLEEMVDQPIDREDEGVPVEDSPTFQESSTIATDEMPQENEPVATRITSVRYPSQHEIDAALQEWNQSAASKRAVVGYMEEHGQEASAAEWLKAEFGDELPAFPITANGAAADLPWEEVQQHVMRLVQDERFFTDEEADRFEDIDFQEAHDRLERSGFFQNVDGQVQDSPFVEQVLADVERIAAEDASVETTVPELAVPVPRYHVGDTVYLDNTAFRIEEIGKFNVRLLDPLLPYPIFRAESKENFESLLWSDVRNAQYLPDAKIETQRPNYEITVSALDAPTLMDRLRDAGISTRQFIYDNGDVTFSFSEDNRDAVEKLAADLRPGVERASDQLRRRLAHDPPLTLSIDFSEHPAFYDRELHDRYTRLSFALGNRLLGTLDEKQCRDRENGKDVRGYDKTDFTITASIDGEPYTYQGRFDIGDGEGDLIAHIRNFFRYHVAPDCPLHEMWHAQGEAYFREQIEHFQWGLDVFIPYLEQHVELTPEDKNLLDEIMATEDDWHRTPDTEVQSVVPEAQSNSIGDAAIEKEALAPASATIHDDLIEEGPSASNFGTIRPEVTESVTTDESAHESQGRTASPATNFRITDDHLGEGGAKTKYGYNIAAIRTLQQIEAEGRSATPEEQETLSRYVGWGGIPQAFDERNEGWAKEYTELKALLTPEEYEAARASSLNAHYTSPTVIRAIYDAVERMGFATGNILEPSCGIGNFFGMLPESMAASRLYGVELDSITGRIAQQLYPKANIAITGYENTDRKDFFDLAVGNVPFGSYKIVDRQYDRYNFLIHDYFFAKAIDQVRPGGVIAFITSKGTMDKQTPDVRRYIAQRAELLGAIRLPNNAFKANAGTEVTTDILFLQKRERPIELEPDWVHLGQTEDGIPINSYFVDHPEMVLGRMAWDKSMYGNEMETACHPIEGADFQEQLAAAIQNIQGQYREAEIPELDEGENDRETIPADPKVKNYSYAIVDGKVYYRENSVMVRPDLNATALERVKGMIALRDCTRALLDAQLNESSDEVIQQYQKELNHLYDSFTAKFGLINARANNQVFRADSSYYLLCSLEVLDEDRNLKRKADMFTKRTVKQRQVVERVDTASEALAISIGERACVDVAFMATMTGLSQEQIIQDLYGVIFRDHQSPPDNPRYLTADAYLSGNVREKLRSARAAAENDPSLQVNVQALESVQPKDLDASEINVRLGATWISQDYIQQFMTELLRPPYDVRRKIKVLYSPHTGEWNISSKGAISHQDVAAYTTYGTQRASAYKILEDTLNLRDVRIYDVIEDEDGKPKRVLNQKETTIAQQKQQAIKDAFRDWVWKDPDRRQALVETYNERFNSIRPREYDGRHLILSGMTPEITLREHQRNAIAHILYGGNTLLAHEVGLGKTFEMIAAAMESKRLGLCQKSMFVVPNHLTEQWASEFLRLYPNANILVTTKKDFEKHNRQKFCSRIATGDYDAIIIGHSQFERIPVSMERQKRLLQEQIRNITDGIKELKEAHGEKFSIKQMEATKKMLEARLQKLTETGKADDVVTFEQLGVDRLYVDEAHAYKNLFLYTKMRNVAGLSTSEAQKSSDMFLKCRYMDELTGGKGVVFATGTPVSNSMTELYTMQRYLQYDTLQRNGMGHFDSWASTFGETTTAIELAPEGTGYRARTRFAKFFNLPELMTMFREVADIKTADLIHLPRPEAHYETVVVEPSEEQKEMVQALSERAAAVHAGHINPSKDNMLKITSDGRKLGLDQRLMNPLLPDHPGSKVNACVNNIFRIWQEGMAERLTQLVFCDLSTPKGTTAGADEHEQQDLSNFSVYDDVRAKLIARGVPPEEIAFIHHADTEQKKADLFSRVRSGKVRVLIGSTAKMGAGTNCQDRLIALHDLDAPWRPGDLEQRAGRIIRQGNMNPEVYIYRYVTEGSFDSYMWQTLENKQKFISQIMTSKSPVRTCDDVDETVLSYAEIKALCAGDDRIREKMDLDVDVARLRLMKANHQSQQFRLEDQLHQVLPQRIESSQHTLAACQRDLSTLEAHPLPEKSFVGIDIRGKHYTDRSEAGAAILDACKDAVHLPPGQIRLEIGQYRGLEMGLSYDSFLNRFQLTLHGEAFHKVELGTDPVGNIQRIDHLLEKLPDRIQTTQDEVAMLFQQQEAAQQELGKPFPQEAELEAKSKRLAVLNAELNIDRSAPHEEKQESAERPPGHEKPQKAKKQKCEEVL